MAAMVGNEVSVVVVAAQTALQGTCDLCARSDMTLRSTVAVQHSSGANASFRACEHCERALRRLAAATCGLTRFVTGGPGTRVTRDLESEGVALLAAAGSPAAEVIQEYCTPLQDAGGTLFLPRVCGGERADGTWIGWVEFLEIGGDGLLRTSRETTQPNVTTLRYWASRLQPTFLEGAFARAHRPHLLRLA